MSISVSQSTGSAAATPAAEALTQAMRQLGVEQLRGAQSDVVRSILAGVPTVAVMPTGAGKSLCYQLPALLLPGVTVVISPLIALMKDQVDQLCARGVAALDLSSAHSFSERQDRMRSIRRGECKLVYVSPERLRNADFQEFASGLTISLLAIDEAHCISQWGHDFRPDYQRIAECLPILKPQRVAAFTATATETVRTDICRALHLQDPALFVRGFDRPNLTFTVEQCSQQTRLTRAVECVAASKAAGKGPAIAYAGTRKSAEDAAAMFAKKKLRTGLYHAGLSDTQRQSVQEQFADDAYDVLVATNAFGMGVDKSNVRLVLHLAMPRCLENYYQEAGRAGRDGEPAEAVLLFNGSDIALQEYFIESAHPTAAVFRALWKHLAQTPTRITGSDDENAVAEKVGAKNGLALSTALRALQSANLVADDGSGVWSARRPEHSDFNPDAPTARKKLEEKRLAAMRDYIYTRSCRRRSILTYFGDEDARGQITCAGCDNCRTRSYRVPTADEIFAAKEFLGLVAELDRPYGRVRLIDTLLGTVDDSRRELTESSSYGALKKNNKEFLHRLCDVLEHENWLERATGEYPVLEISKAGRQQLALAPSSWRWPVLAPTAVTSKKKRRASA